MPVEGSEFSLRALNKTIGYFHLAQQENAALKGAIVLTRGKPNTIIGGQARNVVKEYKVPVLATQMYDRVAYKESLGLPQGVFSSEDKKAQQEIRGIATEIINLMNYG